MSKEKYLTVGELAKKMNVTVRTLQYYDNEGLLTPSAMSEGGRRLYSAKDEIKLNQILSLKYLGFSLEDIKDRLFTLETPGEVATLLKNQLAAVDRQIEEMRSVRDSLAAFREEVLRMNTVDFGKYADIISMLRVHNQDYWVIKLFDDTLMDHLRNRFFDKPELGGKILRTYRELLDEALTLKRAGESSSSEKSKDLAGRWWSMITDFTGGDMTLLPKLMEFNNDKSNWDGALAEKQKEADEFVVEMLESYFKGMNADVPDSGENVHE